MQVVVIGPDIAGKVEGAVVSDLFNHLKPACRFADDIFAVSRRPEKLGVVFIPGAGLVEGVESIRHFLVGIGKNDVHEVDRFKVNVCVHKRISSKMQESHVFQAVESGTNNEIRRVEIRLPKIIASTKTRQIKYSVLNRRQHAFRLRRNDQIVQSLQQCVKNALRQSGFKFMARYFCREWQITKMIPIFIKFLNNVVVSC